MLLETLTIQTAKVAGRRIAVLSDVHANSCYLESAINSIKEAGVELVIFLGDLWTYGCNPNEVLQLMDNLRGLIESVFIRGNHDQFYFNFEDGKKCIDYDVPEFIEESVLWTQAEVDESRKLSLEFDWYRELIIGDIYFSHANPFGKNNWTYLKSKDECSLAVAKLREMKKRVGVFGHTHRYFSAVYSKLSTESPLADRFSWSSENDDVALLNPGSVGQPRGDTPSFLLLEVEPDTLTFRRVQITCPSDEHLRAIKGSNLSQRTRDKLCSYFLNGS